MLCPPHGPGDNGHGVVGKLPFLPSEKPSIARCVQGWEGSVCGTNFTFAFILSSLVKPQCPWAEPWAD